MSSFVSFVLVALTRGLMSIENVLCHPASSSEISTFVETATHKSVENPGRAITVVSVI